VSRTEARSGIWAALSRAIETPRQEPQLDLWDRLGQLVDTAQFRPKLADDVELKEFKLRWGNDYAIIANPRDLIHYQLTPSEAALIPLMDGTRTVKEIVVDRFKESGEIELSGIADLVRQLEAGNFLDHRYVDVDAAVQRAIRPISSRRAKAQGFARTLSVDWANADRFVRFLYEHGLKRLFTRAATLITAIIVVAGFLAFLAVVHSHRYSLSAKSLALGFLILTVLNYFLTFVHELGHALVLVRFGRRVKSAGFMIYFGSPAFFIESADGLMLERNQRILQAFAGGYAELIFCGIAALILWAIPGNAVAPTLYKFAVLGYVVIFLNLVPLLELDGYFIVADLIQVPDLRPKSLSFIRHDLWHKLRHRQRISKQELGLTVYGVLGVLFSGYVIYLSFFFWRQIFGGLVSRLWDGGGLGRIILVALALVIAGPVIRGGINALRAVGRRIRALWTQVQFRLERGWRVEAATLIDALPLFDDVPEDVLNDLAGRVRLRTLARDQPVVRQGERADAFFVVRKGTLQVVEEDPDSGNEKVIRILGPGEAFGEVALMQTAPRSATVRALEESEVFEITKGTFEQLLADMIQVPRFAPTLQAVSELRQLPAFAHLEVDELSEVLKHGEWITFAPGETIISQGEVGDAFYAIRSGQVDVFDQEAKVRTMGPGEHFGELALLLDVPRTATVVAQTPVRAYRLDREGFDALIREAFGRGTLNPAISPDRVWQH
jgi:CRP-like cAMP-binding protein/Zn-dependent protease